MGVRMSEICKICGGATHESWCDGPLHDRIAELEAKLSEIQEIYAGMEGTGLLLPSTQGSYLKHIVKQMYEATLD
jgi:hypothetical protein